MTGCSYAYRNKQDYIYIYIYVWLAVLGINSDLGGGETTQIFESGDAGNSSVQAEFTFYTVTSWRGLL